MSLGSCAWISATTRQPVLDSALHPFVFAHVEKGWYCSAVSILSACTSLSWAKEMLCRDFSAQTDAYQRLDALAAEAPIGANGVLFNPSLAGGGTHRGSPELRGAFLGIRLGSRREDLLRAVLEGIALDLSEIWESFSSHIHMPDALLITGGGAKVHCGGRFLPEYSELKSRRARSGRMRHPLAPRRLRFDVRDCGRIIRRSTDNAAAVL